MDSEDCLEVDLGGLWDEWPSTLWFVLLLRDLNGELEGITRGTATRCLTRT